MQFENSEEAEDSDSPRTIKGGGRISQSLARRLTQELIEYRPSREELSSLSGDSPRRGDSREGLPSTRGPLYPGAKGIRFSGEEGPSEEEVVNNNNGVAGSFSAPTSPTTSRRHSLKVGTLLGLTPSALRRESLRMKQDVAARLLVDGEGYQRHVMQTVDASRRRSQRVPSPVSGGATGSSTVLTSEDIPLEVIMADPVHLRTFRVFAESRLCAESIMFWERVQEYRSAVQQEAAVATALANNIWNNFLASTADKQLLVRENLLQDVRRVMDEGRPEANTFDAIQLEAYSTMQFSLYPEYLQYLNASIAPSSAPSSAPTSPQSRSRSDSFSPSDINNNNNNNNNAKSVSGVPSLRDCLTKRDFYGRFKKFAATILCSENVEFWSRVNAFQAVRDPEQIPEMATKIWDEFLSPASPTELNISSKTRKRIQYELSNKIVTNNTFDEAQRDIYKLISLDVYPKFCQTEFNVNPSSPEDKK